MDKNNSALPYIRLKFNIDHPSLEQCYEDGYECGLTEVDDSENPFHENTLEAKYWLDGWWDGMIGEKRLLAEAKDDEQEAANEKHFLSDDANTMIFRIIKISGAIIASAIIGYHLLDLVA